MQGIGRVAFFLEMIFCVFCSFLNRNKKSQNHPKRMLPKSFLVGLECVEIN